MVGQARCGKAVDTRGIREHERHCRACRELPAPAVEGGFVELPDPVRAFEEEPPPPAPDRFEPLAKLLTERAVLVRELRIRADWKTNAFRHALVDLYQLDTQLLAELVSLLRSPGC